MAVRDGSGGSEEPGKAGMASTANLNGTRRSEKAEVLEGHRQGYSGAERP